MRSRWISASVSVVLAGACATSRPQNAALEQSRAAVRLAEHNDASDDPVAAAYLALARQQIAEAEWLRRHGYAPAIRLAQARANAEVAARRANARAEPDLTERDLDEMSEELQQRGQ